ncbi:hypothetical protein [Methylobacterium fujisawaense]|uniref:hypothetical protein n=1 Tax=Methylobacterium fujisawaense TaxID=107400 RepID=UPI0036FD1858
MYDEPGAFPTPADDFFPECGALPVPPPQETEAERKRRERQERKDAGLPDPRIVDAAIAQAFADVCVLGEAPRRIIRDRSTDKVLVYLRAVVEGALRILVEKGYQKDIAVTVILRRLKLG